MKLDTTLADKVAEILDTLLKKHNLKPIKFGAVHNKRFIYSFWIDFDFRTDKSKRIKQLCNELKEQCIKHNIVASTHAVNNLLIINFQYVK